MRTRRMDLIVLILAAVVVTWAIHSTTPPNAQSTPKEGEHGPADTDEASSIRIMPTDVNRAEYSMNGLYPTLLLDEVKQSLDNKFTLAKLVESDENSGFFEISDAKSKFVIHFTVESGVVTEVRSSRGNSLILNDDMLATLGEDIKPLTSRYFFRNVADYSSGSVIAEDSVNHSVVTVLYYNGVIQTVRLKLNT